jgi:hypothetical protein
MSKLFCQNNSYLCKLYDFDTDNLNLGHRLIALIAPLQHVTYAAKCILVPSSSLPAPLRSVEEVSRYQIVRVFTAAIATFLA